MKIAIQAADLDSARVDGTRVYILNLLKYFGKLEPSSQFLIYHKNNFNPELIPPNFSNYKIKKIGFPIFWTQLAFAWEIWKEKPDVLWMPMHNIPFFRRRGLKTFVTIHDLAYKYFPEHFAKKDLCKLNFLGGLAKRGAKKIIAVSHSTKKDILKFYPEIPEGKIKVIYHGFDSALFFQERDVAKEKALKNKLGIKGNYILYSGAIQPRKNLELLIKAFEIFKQKTGSPIKLVLAGGKAWLWEKTIKKSENSLYKTDIIMPGKLKFGDLGHLMRGASVYVHPSLYEGFGITILEALAAKVPVISAKNSSLAEVGGSAVVYFNEHDPSDLAEKIENVLTNEKLREGLVEKGLGQIKNFSWEKCARETLGYLKS
ncbi:MAG TPA: glycosyltransferase family 1 protein [Patescibacteria group bacterium]